MGRGWATIGKTSRDVTETVLAQAQRGPESRPAVEAFKERLTAAASTPLTFAEVAELAVAEYPLWRASERLALAEQAVWELLHQDRLEIAGPDGSIEPAAWRPLVISWSTWTDDGPGRPAIKATPPAARSDLVLLQAACSAAPTPPRLVRGRLLAEPKRRR